jgi:hypothetical protein
MPSTPPGLGAPDALSSSAAPRRSTARSPMSQPTSSSTRRPISPTTVPIRLDAEMLAQLPEVELVPGMPAEAMIRTGERTVAFYALSPVLDSFHRAFREK